jgi:hypothetical protein
MKNETASKAQPWLSKTPFQPRYEYLTARFKFLGVGKTQEFEYASFNGDVRIPWDTLPEMLKNLGENGWAISSHIPISLGGMTLNGSGSGGYGVQQIVFCRPLETV